MINGYILFNNIRIGMISEFYYDILKSNNALASKIIYSNLVMLDAEKVNNELPAYFDIEITEEYDDFSILLKTFNNCYITNFSKRFSYADIIVIEQAAIYFYKIGYNLI